MSLASLPVALRDLLKRGMSSVCGDGFSIKCSFLSLKTLETTTSQNPCRVSAMTLDEVNWTEGGASSNLYKKKVKK